LLFFVFIGYLLNSLKNQASGTPTGTPAETHGKIKVIATQSQFNEELHLAGNKPIIVDFTATWCGPCQRIAPYFSELSNTYGDSMVFMKVDVDKLNSVAQTYGITSMPTFQMIINKNPVEKFSGADTGRLKAFVLKYNKKKLIYIFF